MFYARIIRKAQKTPWALTPDYLAIIHAILRHRALGDKPDAAALQALVGAADRPARPEMGASIAVIPIWGVIANRAFDATSGMTAIERVRQAFRQALATPSVRGVVLDINSPGGGVPGVPELADEIYAARSEKPIVALIDDLGASAAYWLASQAGEVIAMPTADVGSIGVYTLHISEKAWLDKEGFAVTAIAYGENKLEGAPWEDLSEEYRAYLEQRVTRLGRQFEAAVARGRGVPVSTVREQFGQGRVFSAAEAKRRGMIDRLGSFEDAVARALGRRATAASTAATVPPDRRVSDAMIALTRSLVE